MVRFMNPIILFCLLPLFTAGCEEDSFEPPVDFEFRLLDENGNPSTEFEEGENFVFNFSIINHSNEKFYFKQNSFNRKDFLRVYKIVDEGEGTAMVDKGKPYKGMFCLEYFGGGLSIPPGSSLDFEISWNTEKGDYLAYHEPFCWGTDADFLEKGSYITSIESSFQFSSGEETFTTDTLHFQINFEIR